MNHISIESSNSDTTEDIAILTEDINLDRESLMDFSAKIYWGGQEE
jgi:hypothetical protein